MKYKEQNVDIYTRAVQILINNSVDENIDPSIKFFEEKVMVSAGVTKSLGTDGSVIQIGYTDANKLTEFPMVDPTTNSVVGSQTYEQLFASLYSLYWHLATERDIGMAEIEEEGFTVEDAVTEETPVEDDGTVN
jgi:hypothetical protein